jgi:hypothetical protein
LRGQYGASAVTVTQVGSVDCPTKQLSWSASQQPLPQHFCGAVQTVPASQLARRQIASLQMGKSPWHLTSHPPQLFTSFKASTQT